MQNNRDGGEGFIHEMTMYSPSKTTCQNSAHIEFSMSCPHSLSTVCVCTKKIMVLGIILCRFHWMAKQKSHAQRMFHVIVDGTELKVWKQLWSTHMALCRNPGTVVFTPKIRCIAGCSLPQEWFGKVTTGNNCAILNCKSCSSNYTVSKAMIHHPYVDGLYQRSW